MPQVTITIAAPITGLDERTYVVEADTVGAALVAFFYQDPDLTRRLFIPPGRLSPGIDVLVDDNSIRFRDGLATPVGPASRIIIQPRTLDLQISEREPYIVVDIAIEDAVVSEIAALDLERDLVRLLETFGYLPPREFAAGQGSWYKRLFFWPTRELNPHERERMSEELADTLHQAITEPERRSSDRTSTVMDIVRRLDGFDDAIIRIDDVIVIKRTIDGRRVLVVNTISDAARRGLDDNIELVRDLDRLADSIARKDFITAYANNDSNLAEAISGPEQEELLRILRTRFDESELRDLCFSLGVDYENLPGQGPRDKTRELILYAERRGEYQELIKHIREKRPDIEL